MLEKAVGEAIDEVLSELVEAMYKLVVVLEGAM